jgi:hypothetical protein
MIKNSKNKYMSLLIIGGTGTLLGGQIVLQESFTRLSVTLCYFQKS